MSAETTCNKIPMTRKEANRIVRGKGRDVRAKGKNHMCNTAGLNAYRCPYCPGEVYHTGHWIAGVS